MSQIIIGIVLVIIGLTALLLQRLYSFVPAKELKRLARQGDSQAMSLYRVAAYAEKGRLLIWLIVAIGLSVGVVLIVQRLPVVFGTAVGGLVFLLALVVVPSLSLSHLTIGLATTVSAPLAWTVATAYRPLSLLAVAANRYRHLDQHTNLYEVQDLAQLLERQGEQPDNRIGKADLELARRALHFKSTTADEVLIPRQDTFTVNADDAIGPVLLDQLHSHGQTAYLVYKDTKDNLIGTLRVRDAVAAKNGGRVFDFMRPDISSVKESSSLQQVLDVLQKTEQRIVVVFNEFEDFVGLITLEDLLAHLFGHSDEEKPQEGTPSPEATEVVE